MSAAFVAQYGRYAFHALKPPRLAMLTIAPPPRLDIQGAAERDVRTAALTFTSKASSSTLLAQVLERRLPEHPAVVHQDIQAAQDPRGLVDEAGHLAGPARVGGEGHHPVAALRQRLHLTRGALATLAVREGHAGPFLCEGTHERAPEAPTSAGHRR